MEATAPKEGKPVSQTTPLTEALPRPRQVPQLRRRIVVLNQKGGAGKTTTAVTLAAIWAEAGYRVRLIDADPQLGGSTLWLLGQQAMTEDDELPPGLKTLLGVFLDKHGLNDAAIEVRPNLWLVPSDGTLKEVENKRPAGAELALVQGIVESDQDVIDIIDCPPNLGVLAVAGLLAGQDLVIPVRASGLDLPAMRELNGTLATVRKRLNPELRTSAVLVTDAHNNLLTEKTFNRLRQDYPETTVMKIRHSVRASEAPTVAEPLTDYAADATTTADYRRLANHQLPGSVATRG